MDKQFYGTITCEEHLRRFIHQNVDNALMYNSKNTVAITLYDQGIFITLIFLPFDDISEAIKLAQKIIHLREGERKRRNKRVNK